MNTSNYTDKQITELSNRRTRRLVDDDEEDDQDQGFEFHPIHSHIQAQDETHLRGWSSMDHIDSPKFSGEKVGISSGVQLISRIDQKLKEHADVLLHSVECLSARVSQMESRTRQLENAFDDLKEAIEFSHGRTDGKLRELEAILVEVQGGIKDLRDKQEIAETQLWLAKLRVLKDDMQSEKQYSTAQSNSGAEALPSVSQKPNQPLPVPVAYLQPVLGFFSNMTNLPLQNHSPTPPAATAPRVPTPSASQLPPVAATPPHLPSQLSQNAVPSGPQHESYYQTPISSAGTSLQQYVPPMQQSPLPPHTHLPSQLPHLHPPNSHLPHLPQVHSPFTLVNPRVQSHNPKPIPYGSSQCIHRSSQPHDRPLSPQLCSADQPQNLHHPESFSANSQLLGPQPQEYTNIVDFYRHSAPNYTSSSTMKPFQSFASPPVNSGQISFSQLPTARMLQHAIPTASSVDSESSSSGSGNSVPVDDVIDKVVAMGFRRDLVRATVKKLAENGQSVDLNIVLDKLMNNG